MTAACIYSQVNTRCSSNSVESSTLVAAGSELTRSIHSTPPSPPPLFITSNSNPPPFNRSLTNTPHSRQICWHSDLTMYSSNSTDYQKFSDSNASAPPYDSSTPTGIPVSSTDPYYSGAGAKAEPRPPLPPKPLVPWSTGLCDCFSDVNNCCLTFWCPCITFGRISEIVDKGSSSCGVNGALYTLIACVTGCPCFYSCFYRSKMRQQYSLHESPCGDCLIHCCCESCALCQEYRELKNRGFDMTIGWHGNVERQNRGIAMAPIVEGGMSR